MTNSMSSLVSEQSAWIACPLHAPAQRHKGHTALRLTLAFVSMVSQPAETTTVITASTKPPARLHPVIAPVCATRTDLLVVHSSMCSRANLSATSGSVSFVSNCVAPPLQRTLLLQQRRQPHTRHSQSCSKAMCCSVWDGNAWTNTVCGCALLT